MFDAKVFLEALNELESSKGISKDSILAALKEAMEKGFRKELGGDDALVEVNIDIDAGTIDMAQIKKVVEDVEDDFLEISLEDARKENPNIQVGEDFRIPCSPDAVRKSTAMSIKSVLKQKIAEVEKEALYNAYKDKIGEMITGVVEKVDDRGLYANVGRTTVFVSKRELIGDEKFYPKDIIRLYVSDVATGTKGARILVSRANEGFLKRIFEEEIHEVYDGTIVIKGIARKAGERSKVAVTTNDPNVDPAGACIGPNGQRIQKVVGQLGNGSTKEKVDVIGYNENPGLFIIEALKPAQVLGVNVNKEDKTALAVVQNETLSLAYGRKWVNIKLAEQLTGYHIEIKELDTALNDHDTYLTVEDLERIDIEEKQAAAQKAFEEQQRIQKLLDSIPEGYVAPSQRHYEDEISEEEQAMLEAQVDLQDAEAAIEEEAKALEEAKVEETPVAPVEEEKVEETPVTAPVKEEVKKPEVKVEKVEEPIVKTNVKTTTTLEALESALADEAKKSKNTSTKYRKKKKEEKVEEESVITNIVDPSQRMSIYTKEELEEIEQEESQDNYDDYDDDVDYDEYDEYYDDENN